MFNLIAAKANQSSGQRKNIQGFVRQIYSQLTTIGYFALMSPWSQLLGAFIWRAPTDEKLVALTFDDGPNEPFTTRILDVLDAHGAVGTSSWSAATSIAFRRWRAGSRSHDTSSATTPSNIRCAATSFGARRCSTRWKPLSGTSNASPVPDHPCFVRHGCFAPRKSSKQLRRPACAPSAVSSATFSKCSSPTGGASPRARCARSGPDQSSSSTTAATPAKESTAPKPCALLTSSRVRSHQTGGRWSPSPSCSTEPTPTATTYCSGLKYTASHEKPRQLRCSGRAEERSSAVGDGGVCRRSIVPPSDEARCASQSWLRSRQPQRLRCLATHRGLDDSRRPPTQRAWVAPAIALASLSMLAAALQQRRVLRAGGLSLPLRAMVAITLAANAVSVHLATGRQHRRHRVHLSAAEETRGGPAIDSLGVGNIRHRLHHGARLRARRRRRRHRKWCNASGRSGGRAARHRPDRGAVVVVPVRHGAVPHRAPRHAHTREGGTERRRRTTAFDVGCVSRGFERMALFRLGWRAGGTAATYSLVNWIADVACLAMCIAALGVSVPWTHLVLVYGATLGAASLSFTPAGIGIVESAIAVALVESGVPTPTAIVARCSTARCRVGSCWPSAGSATR